MGCPSKEEIMETRPIMRITLTPTGDTLTPIEDYGCEFVLKVELFGDPDAITQDERMRIAEAICVLAKEELFRRGKEL